MTDPSKIAIAFVPPETEEFPDGDIEEEISIGTCATCGDETCPPHRPHKCASCANVMVVDDSTASCLAKGVQIILTVQPDAEVDAGYEELFCGEADLPVAICDELERLGWHYDNDAERWAIFA